MTPKYAVYYTAAARLVRDFRTQWLHVYPFTATANYGGTVWPEPELPAEPDLVFEGRPDRVRINQPSTLNDLHCYHGSLAVAFRDGAHSRLYLPDGTMYGAYPSHMLSFVSTPPKG